MAAIRASQLGFKTAIIEKKVWVVSVPTGCIPTTLLKSAQVNEYTAKDYGIEASGTPDFAAVIKRTVALPTNEQRGSVPDEEEQDRRDHGLRQTEAKGQLEVTGSDGKHRS